MRSDRDNLDYIRQLKETRYALRSNDFVRRRTQEQLFLSLNDNVIHVTVFSGVVINGQLLVAVVAPVTVILWHARDV